MATPITTLPGRDSQSMHESSHSAGADDFSACFSARGSARSSATISGPRFVVHRAAAPNTPRPTPSREARPTFRTVALPGREVLVHSSHDRFESHVERHLASEEAVRALAFAHPDLAGDVDGSGICNTPREIIRALRRGIGHAHGAELVRRYSCLAARTLDEAHAVGWVIRPNPAVVVGFSPTGFLAVVDGGILRTLFVPGLVSDETRHAQDGHYGADARAQERREAGWSATVRHYHAAFRPALGVIRSLPVGATAGECSQYGALKRVLPSAAALRLEGWLARLHAARGGAALDA
jgi:hypothetical protein